MPSLLYYMGSRAFLKPKILPTLLRLAEGCEQYREPFAGGLSIGLSMMSRCTQLTFWINDRDPTVACYWWALRHASDEIAVRIPPFQPSLGTFRAAKSLLNRTIRIPEDRQDIIEAAFARLAIQNMSFSSMGSGPRGGNHQFYGCIGERWRPDAMIRELELQSRRLQRLNVTITGFDFGQLILDDTCRSLLYLDPPFFGMPNNYNYELTLADHQRLADLLGQTRHPWVLSYGDHPQIWRLYQGWARIEEIGRKNLLITRE